MGLAIGADLPVSIDGRCDGRTLVSLDQSAELDVSADIALILAFCERSGETVDELGLVSRESETTTGGFGLVVDIFDERFGLRYSESSYCFHEQLRKEMVKVEASGSRGQYVVRKRQRNDNCRSIGYLQHDRQSRSR